MLQKLLIEQWVFVATSETTNIMLSSDHWKPLPEDPLMLAENKIHGELILLLYFLISYGHDLLTETGRDHFFAMQHILINMHSVLRLIEQLVKLEGDIWDEVTDEMAPCACLRGNNLDDVHCHC